MSDVTGATGADGASDARPSGGYDEESASSVFVHDFVGIDLPLADVVEVVSVVATPSSVSEMISSAWRAEITALDASQERQIRHQQPVLDVILGPPRGRRDAIVVPISWSCRSADWVPPIDADLEFAAFGPNRTHLHLYGRSQLPPGQHPSSEQASLSNRLTVAVVRHMLTLFTTRIADRAIPEF